MQSRRDQVQAHTYVLGRLSSALVHAEPDAAETPLRRTTLGWFAGLMIGMLLVAVFAVFGVIFHGGSRSWTKPHVLIVEKETGTRYVFADGTLHPVLNYASALLLLGTSKPDVRAVSKKSLAGVSHGRPVGIVGAPETMPTPGPRGGGSWLVCAASQPDESGTPQPLVTVQMGAAAAGTPVPPGQAVLVRTPDDTRYLVWRTRRLKLTAQWIADALGLGSVPPVTVDPVWLNAMPSGPDLAPMQVDGRGQPGPRVAGRTLLVGQVVAVRNVGTDDAFHLVRPDGLERLTKTEAALLLGDPATAAAYPGSTVQPVVVAAGAAATAPPGPASGSGSDDADDVPAAPPHPAELLPGQVPCARHDTAAGDPDTSLVAAYPPPTSAVPAVGVPGVAADSRIAGRIGVAPGWGCLARPLLPSGAGGASYYLVTDLGVKYPVPTRELAATLGYDASGAALVPASMLALLPTGPALDPAALGPSAPPGVTAM